MTTIDFDTRKQRLKTLANELIEEIEALKNPSEPEISVTAERQDDHILLHLTGNVQDIQYAFGNGKSHSVQWMLNNGYNPPEIEGDTYKIGSKRINEEFFVVVGSGAWNEDKNRFIFDEEKTASDSLPKKETSSDDEGGNQDGIKSPKPLSTNPDDWEVQGKVLSGKKIVAGLTEINGVAHMLVQSQKKIDGVWTNCGEVYVSDDLKEWKPVSENPVLITPMDWQGQDNGIPHRIAPRTLFGHRDKQITYTRDRLGDYPGIRGVGVFSSDNLINWKGYDRWFLDARMVQKRVPRKYLSGREYERCYLKCATVGPDGIYIIVNIEDVEGEDSTFVFRGTDPLDFSTFEFIEAPWHTAGRIVDNIYFINNKWIWIGRGDAGFDTVAIKEMAGWDEPFEFSEPGFRIAHDGPRETIYPFYFKDQWHLFYDDNKSGRNIHLATQTR